MTKSPNYGGNPYEQGTKSFRSRKQIQALVVNNTATHKIAARCGLATLGARVGSLSNVVTATVLQPVLTAAWKAAPRLPPDGGRRTLDTRVNHGAALMHTAARPMRGIELAGVAPGPSEAINEHTPLESRADQSPAHHLPLSGGTRGQSYLHRLAPFSFGAA